MKNLAMMSAVAFATVSSVLAHADEGKLPLEASVKVLESAAPSMSTAMSMTVMRRPLPAPTTPGGKYPQYQTSRQHRQTVKSDDATNPHLRFFLALPKRILLIDASITVDNLPFRMVREKRVERIMKDALTSQHAVVAPPTTPTETEQDDQQQPAPVPANAAVPKNLMTSNVADRLRHSMKVTGDVSSPEEAHWILSNWVDGPVIMQLNDNFQRFRANQRPGFVILDRDRDGTVSAEELQMAVQSFQECDLNQDGIVSFTEISTVASDPRVKPEMPSWANVVTIVPDESSSVVAYQRLLEATNSTADGATPPAVSRFDANRDGRFDAEELRAIHTVPADMNIAISFNTSNPEQSRISMTGVAADFQEVIRQSTVDETEIVMTIEGTPVHVSAVQMLSSDQISIGAVLDGYPLLPSIDPNDDGRLTTRELRTLLQTLKTFDRNGDGSLTADEAQAPLRVCIGLGPIVHRQLIGIRSVHRNSSRMPVSGPEWFTRMDRNKDNDLTRGEFPGTDEQFQTLDADADGLISADEALRFDKRTEGADENSDGKEAPEKDATSSEETKPK